MRGILAVLSFGFFKVLLLFRKKLQLNDFYFSFLTDLFQTKILTDSFAYSDMQAVIYGLVVINDFVFL